MAWYTALIDFGFNFVLYAGFALLLIAVLAAVSWPILKKRFFPIPFIRLKNAGGAKNTNTIVLDEKIVLRGRIIQTEYGPRIKVLGIPNTIPMGVLSRDNAIPYEGGGVAFMIYEKEIGQFFPINPEIADLGLTIPKKEEEGRQVKKLYEHLLAKYPDLSHAFHLLKPDRVAVPLSFANHDVVLHPFPVEANTQYMVDYKLRMERTMRAGFWQKYGTLVIGLASIALVIVAIVLTYEWTGERLDAAISGTAERAADKFGERIANYLGEEAAPGGGIFIPGFWWALKRRKKNGMV